MLLLVALAIAVVYAMAALPQDPTRGIRPPNFSGRREDFEAWAFQFDAYGGLLD